MLDQHPPVSDMPSSGIISCGAPTCVCGIRVNPVMPAGELKPRCPSPGMAGGACVAGSGLLSPLQSPSRLHMLVCMGDEQAALMPAMPIEGLAVEWPWAPPTDAPAPPGMCMPAAGSPGMWRGSGANDNSLSSWLAPVAACAWAGNVCVCGEVVAHCILYAHIPESGEEVVVGKAGWGWGEKSVAKVCHR